MAYRQTLYEIALLHPEEGCYLVVYHNKTPSRSILKASFLKRREMIEAITGPLDWYIGPEKAPGTITGDLWTIRYTGRTMLEAQGSELPFIARGKVQPSH